MTRSRAANTTAAQNEETKQRSNEKTKEGEAELQYDSRRHPRDANTNYDGDNEWGQKHTLVHTVLQTHQRRGRGQRERGRGQRERGRTGGAVRRRAGVPVRVLERARDAVAPRPELARYRSGVRDVGVAAWTRRRRRWRDEASTTATTNEAAPASGRVRRGVVVDAPAPSPAARRDAASVRASTTTRVAEVAANTLQRTQTRRGAMSRPAAGSG
jgi:hypothetical protein